jgi:uncharacterized protein (TIGR02996 family)
MSDEQAFLSAIMSNPDNQTAKLVYADWLQERDDPRAEVVRLKVAVDTQAEGWVAARERLTELEPTVPATWLVLLDGPVWCVTGNIVESRPFGPGGAETRHGTRLFRPNAKVHLADVTSSYWLFVENPQAHHIVRVIGRHRKSRDWIGCILRVANTTNWRVELVYQPGALARLRTEGWPGFRLQKGEFVCPEDKTSPDAVRKLLALLGSRGTP